MSHITGDNPKRILFDFTSCIHINLQDNTEFNNLFPFRVFFHCYKTCTYSFLRWLLVIQEKLSRTETWQNRRRVEHPYFHIIYNTDNATETYLSCISELHDFAIFLMQAIFCIQNINEWKEKSASCNKIFHIISCLSWTCWWMWNDDGVNVCVYCLSKQ